MSSVRAEALGIVRELVHYGLYVATAAAGFRALKAQVLEELTRLVKDQQQRGARNLDSIVYAEASNPRQTTTNKQSVIKILETHTRALESIEHEIRELKRRDIERTQDFMQIRRRLRQNAGDAQA